MDTTPILVGKILDSHSALTPKDGDQIFNAIKQPIKDQKAVILDFHGIEIVTTAFLNAAIGQLYSIYSSEILNDYLKIENLSSANRPLLIKVISRAKEYFKDKKTFEDSIDKSISDD